MIIPILYMSKVRFREVVKLAQSNRAELLVKLTL